MDYIVIHFVYMWPHIYDLKKGLRGTPKNVDQRDTAECSQLGGGVCILDAERGACRIRVKVKEQPCEIDENIQESIRLAP